MKFFRDLWIALADSSERGDDQIRMNDAPEKHKHFFKLNKEGGASF